MKKRLLAFISALAFSISAFAAVDLNTASEAELQSVKGIGPAKAKAIVDYRKKNGDFKSADDLEKVPGFGKKSVDKIKKDISVGNATAAAAGKNAGAKSVKERTKGKAAEKDAKPEQENSKAEDKPSKADKKADKAQEKAAKKADKQN